MAGKKRKSTQPSLPLSKGEVWEVGRRPLNVHVDELARRKEQPEILLAVQTGAAGGIVLGDPITSSAPPTALADFVLQAMRQPLIGKPRRPALIRVASQADAELLAVSLTSTGVALEITPRLEALDTIQEQMASMLGSLTNDYRTQAIRAGETLSAAGLRAFFDTARAFYREEMWTVYGDEVMFEIVLGPAHGSGTTLYGILMGSMGEEFGLALFRSFDDLQRFHEVSLQHLDEITPPPPARGRKRPDQEQLRREAEAMDEVLQVPSIGLTYTPQRDVAPPLVQEAQQLKLPLANKSAFPLVMCTGQGGMRVATATDLAMMFVALQAILDWDKRIDDVAEVEETDVTITSQLDAVEGFTSALTVHTTLRVNPCLPEDEEDDEDEEGDEDEEVFLERLGDFFTSLLDEASDRKPVKKARQPSSKNQHQAPGNSSPSPAALNRVYTLDVALVGGPMTEDYDDQEIIRRIDILGRQTLHDLHEAIFDAFERWEEHLYEFNLGTGPGDRSQIYFYTGDWEADDEEAGDPEMTALATLDLQVGRRFGYTFDMGDQWEHVIEVVATKEGTGKGTYPRLVKKIGAAPPQYPEDDEEDE
jgi:Plasmid pRiA4b ORF-3-like protein